MKDAAAREQTDTETDAEGHGLRVPFSAAENPPAVRRRLAKLIAAKLILDLLFVGAFALYTHAVTFGRDFEGELEHVDGRGARGWVVDLERPGDAVGVQLFLNGKFAATTIASESRPDDAAGTRRAFVFEFERPHYGEYEARVYAVREGRGGARRTLHQIGDPRHFFWK